MQVCRVATYCCCLSPPKLSYDGSRYTHELVTFLDIVPCLGPCSTGIPHHILGSLVHWGSCPASRKTTWDSNYSAEQHRKIFFSFNIVLLVHLPLRVAVQCESVGFLSHLILESRQHWPAGPCVISFQNRFSLGPLPDLLFVLQVLSIACCVFYSHCGNTAALKAKAKSMGRQWSSSLLFEDARSWNLTSWGGWPQMQEVKEQVCNNWLGPVGSARDYPVFSKWVLYGEVKIFICFASVLLE